MNDLTCERWSERLAGYIDGALAPGDRAAFEAHATSCGACRQFLNEYMNVPSIVRRATDVAIPSEVRARLARLFAPDTSGKKEPP